MYTFKNLMNWRPKYVSKYLQERRFFSFRNEKWNKNHTWPGPITGMGVLKHTLFSDRIFGMFSEISETFLL